MVNCYQRNKKNVIALQILHRASMLLKVNTSMLVTWHQIGAMLPIFINEVVGTWYLVHSAVNIVQHLVIIAILLGYPLHVSPLLVLLLNVIIALEKKGKTGSVYFSSSWNCTPFPPFTAIFSIIKEIFWVINIIFMYITVASFN